MKERESESTHAPEGAEKKDWSEGDEDRLQPNPCSSFFVLLI